MNILHLSALRNWGGGENHIANLCSELQDIDKGVKNYIFCTRGGQFHKKLTGTNYNVIPATLRFNLDPAYIFKLIYSVKKFGIDLIHIHDTTALSLVVIADKFSNLPPFIFSKKTSFPIKNRKGTLYKYNYPKIKKILCVSEATKEVTSQSIQDHSKLKTIYHGTNLKTKSIATSYLLRDLPYINPDSIIIGNIANHIRSKNLETLIETAHILINIYGKKNYQFIQIGDFTDRTENLKSLIQKYNLENNFHFLGMIENASNFIPQFDLFVLSSQSEGLAGVIYEAFYHKVPVISTNVGGISEIITHNVNGKLAPAHNAEAIAEEILNLENHQELKQDFITRSKHKVMEMFTTESMAKNTLEQYNIVLNGKS